MASGWRFFLGQPDCPDGLSRAGRCRLVTEVEGKNSPVWVAAGPRGSGFLFLEREGSPVDRHLLRLLRPLPSPGAWGEGGLSLTAKHSPPPSPSPPKHKERAGTNLGWVIR